MATLGVQQYVLMMMMAMLVCAAAAAHINKTILLKDIRKAVVQLQNQSEIQSMCLPKINEKCSPIIFCKAEVALNKLMAKLPKNVNKEKLENLQRLFHVYNTVTHTGRSHCALKSSPNYTVMAFLEKMKHCVTSELNKTAH